MSGEVTAGLGRQKRILDVEALLASLNRDFRKVGSTVDRIDKVVEHAAGLGYYPRSVRYDKVGREVWIELKHLVSGQTGHVEIDWFGTDWIGSRARKITVKLGNKPALVVIPEWVGEEPEIRCTRVKIEVEHQ